MADDAVLSALEATFLYAETPMTPMHVGSLATYDAAGWRDARGRLRVRALRTHVGGRLAGLTRLRQHPRWPVAHAGRPRWVDDPAFDIARHVRTVRAPRPGDEAALLAVVEDLHMSLLDRDHPLWELWFVDGLAGGQVAVVEKIHHALVDGIGGVDLAMMLLDTSPAAPPATSAPSAPHDPEPSGLALLGGTARAAASEPLVLGRSLASAAAHPRRAAGTTRRLATAAGSMAGDLLPPRSSLNDPVGTRRRYRVIRRSLDRTRTTARTLGGTVNDASLCAVAGGLVDLLASRHEELHPGTVHALVPVSVRREDEHGVLGNRVSAMIVALPTDQADPEARFRAVSAATRAAKDHHQAELSAALLAIPEHWPEPAVAALARLVHHQPLVNLVVTNVPGPPVPLYLMGARMLEVFPIVPLARNLTVSVGILSYEHHLTLGLWADRDRFADLEVLARGIERGFSQLDALARSTRNGGER